MIAAKASNSSRHIPVLLDELVEALRLEPSGSRPVLVLDCTLGGGGHAEALLEAHPDLFLAAIDRDNEAVQRSALRLERFSDRIVLKHSSFGELSEVFGDIAEAASSYYQASVSQCDAVYADLGVSSDQLDDSERGFSFQAAGPLDMRMDRTQTLTAAAVLNEYQPSDLKRVFLKGGVRRGAKALAAAVVKARPLQSTDDFRAACRDALGAEAGAPRKADPATVPFQAVRIEVNDELDALERMLDQAFAVLRPGGRLAVISFHSREDQAVARKMRRWGRPESEPLGLPQRVHVRQGELITKHALRAGADEVARNPRARSALMRVFEKGGER